MWSVELGLSWRAMMVDIILPQAVKIVIPPLTNNCINVVKDTALASVVAMPDLLKQATQAQALAAAGVRFGREIHEIPGYHLGEFFLASVKNVNTIFSGFIELWPRMIERFKNGLPKFNEEAQTLSYLYYKN